MIEEEELLPISALQHLVFCERQCALIHVEREWEENYLTAEGRVLHENVDEGYRAYRRGVKQFAGVHVRSVTLGIGGRLDVVELVKIGEAPHTCVFLGLEGAWEIHPIEFKRGKPKDHDADRVQLCAQALCLEEMTHQHIASGSLFYGKIRRREEVAFSPDLRLRTAQLIVRLKEVVSQALLPPPVWTRKCRSCSFVDLCQPRITSGRRTSSYRKELLG